MGNLSEHFDREEFICSCGECGQDTVDVRLVILLEQIRVHFDRPVRINSGNRCKAHNKAVGGSINSQHLLSKAADITVDGTPPSLVAELAHNIGAGGVGKYETFTHLDSRTGIARW